MEGGKGRGRGKAGAYKAPRGCTIGAGKGLRIEDRSYQAQSLWPGTARSGLGRGKPPLLLCTYVVLRRCVPTLLCLLCMYFVRTTYCACTCRVTFPLTPCTAQKIEGPRRNRWSGRSMASQTCQTSSSPRHFRALGPLAVGQDAAASPRGNSRLCRGQGGVILDVRPSLHADFAPARLHFKSGTSGRS